jgi:proteic killer suppression protein
MQEEAASKVDAALEAAREKMQPSRRDSRVLRIMIRESRGASIRFKTEKLAKQYSTAKLLLRAHGEARAKLIRRRLDELRAVVVLDDLRNTPGRLHELKGDRKGQLSLDLDGPYRLLFAPNHNPVPATPEGGLDWTRITAVTIPGVEDTHE